MYLDISIAKILNISKHGWVWFRHFWFAKNGEAAGGHRLPAEVQELMNFG